RAARPHRAQRPREGLSGLVAGPREGEDLAALRARHLRQDVRGRPEAVEAELPAVAGQPQRAEADQACAQQGGRLQVGVAGREGEAEARVGHGVLRVSAVDVIAGEARLVAEVLLAGAAVAARAVRPAQPGHADAIADAPALDVRPTRFPGSDDLMAR